MNSDLKLAAASCPLAARPGRVSVSKETALPVGILGATVNVVSEPYHSYVTEL